jgi:hypothetical protein
MYDYQELRNSLISSFGYQYTTGQVYWPKAFSNRQRSIMPISVPSVVARISSDLHNVLYRQPSLLRAHDLVSGSYCKTVGEGLFSSIGYKKGDIIVRFIGELVSVYEMQLRDASGHFLRCIPHRLSFSHVYEPWKQHSWLTPLLRVASTCGE